MTFRGRVAKAHTFRHLCWCFPMLFSGGRYPGHPPKEGEIWKLLFENQMKVVLPGSTTTDWTHHIKTKTQARNNKKHHQKKKKKNHNKDYSLKTANENTKQLHLPQTVTTKQVHMLKAAVTQPEHIFVAHPTANMPPRHTMLPLHLLYPTRHNKQKRKLHA